MKKSVKNLIRFICFILIICILTTVSSYCLQANDRKDIMHLRSFFLEPENSIDVALVGASELYTGFCSPMAWDQFGFTSYSFCYAGMVSQHYKPAVKEVLTKQNPKLIIIEINGFTCGDKYSKNPAKAHTFLDNIPRDSLRKEFIEETIPKENRNEYYFSFIKYHDNWKHIKSFCLNLRNKLIMLMKGPAPTKAFATKNKTLDTNKLKKYTPKPGKIAEQSLIELLEYLKDNNINNVLFVRFPHCVNNKNPEVYEHIISAINSYGFKFKDFEKEREALNLEPSKFFYHYGHLNVFGMEKFTPIFAEYLVSNYDLKSEHSDEIVKEWDKSWQITEKLLKKAEMEEPPEKDIEFFYEYNGYSIS